MKIFGSSVASRIRHLVARPRAALILSFIGGVITTSIVSIAAITAAELQLVPKPEAVPRMALILDKPRPENALNSLVIGLFRRPDGAEYRTKLDAAIKQRLYCFLETLAVARGQSWSLAHWAQIEWALKTLNGDPVFHDKQFASVYAEFEAFHFLNLMRSRLDVAIMSERGTIQDAIAATTNLIATLEGVSAESSEELLRPLHDELMKDLYTKYKLQNWQTRFTPVSIETER